MSADNKATRQRTDQDAFAILAALGMTYREATICAGADEWFVLLHIPCKQPPLTEFDGWPIRYEHVGKTIAL